MSNDVRITSRQNNVSQFIESLQSLDRGDLAALKRNAGSTIAEARGASGVFFRILPSDCVGQREEEVYFMVATLFGLNKYPFRGNFGETMARVRIRSGSDSVDRRFSILLDSQFGIVDGWKPGGGELPYRMRQCVRLAASKEVGVDWVELSNDLLFWTHANRTVQKKWASSYFGQGNKLRTTDNEEVS